ncbi:hypothetical protein ACFPK9_13440 [Rubritalea spongiae]|uniref:Tetratricopeptide repeat protein n=1 Tax=Rubritalea spongiae TaxID=430797 RepID=A0ABW5E033_9BACT
MNENKEQDTPEANEDWWFQYLSEDEKLERQRAAGLLEEQAEVENTSEPQWKVVARTVRKHAPKAAAIVGIGLAVTHWAVVTVKLGNLQNQHQATLETLEKRESEISQEREFTAQKEEALNTEKAQVAAKEKELALNQEQMQKQAEEAGKELSGLRESIQKMVGLSQEIYALKTEARHGVLLDLEDEKAREQAIQKSWEELSKSLAEDAAFEGERALINLRVLQSQALAGEIELHDLGSIDWEAAGMEQERALILARIYYKHARNLASQGKQAEAEALVESCIELMQNMEQATEEHNYISGMFFEVKGDLKLKEEPRVALKHYLTAIKFLDAVVKDAPDSRKLRTKLAQLCQSVSVLPSIDGKSAWSEELKQQAREQASWLVAQDPQCRSAHLLLAKLDVVAAEDCLRERKLSKVDDLLGSAKRSLDLGGGDVLIQSSLDGVRAFLAWDKGNQRSAIELMDRQVDALNGLLVAEPDNVSAYCRCAALLWARSMMQTSTVKARSDGDRALDLLASVLSGPACLRSVSARRMSARILCDLAEIEMHAGSKRKAKDYLVRSEKLWAEIRSQWGLSAEDREMEHWCVYQLTLL